ncbi:MAG TPA: TlpA disulfide reductase family protein [Jatrophihabitans sp.]|nr:TlpA disulfide reductase family protein [Jatrophihabitans sp.]
MTRALLALVTAAVALTACVGRNAVDQNGNSEFQFTSGNQLGQLYPQADRKKAGTFSGDLLDGRPFSLAQTAGKVVVVNFWAAWCGPCKTETPQFDLVYRQLKSRGVDFVGIDTKDVKSNAQSFVNDYNISYPIVYDEQGQSALRLGNLPATALPFTVLIDKLGRVAAVYIIRLSAKDLTGALDKLVAERT